MTLPRRAEKLTIYLDERERHGRVSEFVEIVEAARQAGLAGATVIQGLEGFGAAAQVHRWRALRVTEDVPVVITIVDTPDKIDGFLGRIDGLVAHGLVLRQQVEVVLHRANDADQGGEP